MTDLAPLTATALRRGYPTRRDPRPVLDGLDLTVAPGTRLGVIGENGSGKSTLLRLLAGLERPDAGEVRAPRDLVHLPQDPGAAPDCTVGDLLGQALRPLHAAVAELERLARALADGEPGAAAAYDRALAWATHHDAWDADRRAEVTATVLGVGDLDRDRPVATLSGGQRTRLALTAALVRRPACLLLDEPTNHLDDQALDLLESSLVDLPGVVVAASHDRTFLDRVCTELVDLDAGALGTDGRGGRRFRGRFTDYLSHQAASRRRWEGTYAAQQDEIDRLRRLTRQSTAAVAHDRAPRDNDKLGYHVKGGNVERTHARRVHDAERRLAVAERDTVRRPPPPLRFSARLTGAPAAGSGLAVSVRDLVVAGAPGDGPRVVVERLDVPTGGQVLVVGPNGSGKSTLLDVLAGRIRPATGTVAVRARTVRLVAQDPDLGPAGRTAAAAYLAVLGPDRAARVPLRSLGLLHPRDHATPVGALSLGQQRRLSLALAVAAAPDLLLLDEPTNHVSLALAAELEEALVSSPGTVIVTSHDRWLRSRWDGAVLRLADR